jgi:hypothetical protein
VAAASAAATYTIAARSTGAARAALGGMAREPEVCWFLVDGVEGLVFQLAAGTMIDSSKLRTPAPPPPRTRIRLRSITW